MTKLMRKKMPKQNIESAVNRNATSHSTINDHLLLPLLRIEIERDCFRFSIPSCKQIRFCFLFLDLFFLRQNVNNSGEQYFFGNFIEFKFSPIFTAFKSKFWLWITIYEWNDHELAKKMIEKSRLLIKLKAKWLSFHVCTHFNLASS